MKKVVYSFIVLILLVSCGSEQKTNEGAYNGEGENVTIEEVKFPTKLKLAETELVLNGGGVRKLYFFKIFVAGLYLPVKSHDAQIIINADEPSIIRLHAVSKAITSERLSDAIQERLNEVTKGQGEKFQSRIDLMREKLKQEKIEIGDECDICYTPNEGIRLLKNGKDLNVLITGLDFKQALWANWMGENPADENLKKGLLGL